MNLSSFNIVLAISISYYSTFCSSLLIQDVNEDLSQCGVPWDDVNAIAEAAIIKKCKEDLADGYPSFCGFRLYFEILWDYMTGTGTLDDEIVDMAKELFQSLMSPDSETESIVRKVFNRVIDNRGDYEVNTEDATKAGYIDNLSKKTC
uniref:Uncharacterized protein n=1 Tax=Tetranychus urticae TaxID=32264 RepID=T1K9V4_TETUR